AAGVESRTRPEVLPGGRLREVRRAPGAREDREGHSRPARHRRQAEGIRRADGGGHRPGDEKRRGLRDPAVRHQRDAFGSGDLTGCSTIKTSERWHTRSRLTSTAYTKLSKTRWPRPRASTTRLASLSRRSSTV